MLLETSAVLCMWSTPELHTAHPEMGVMVTRYFVHPTADVAATAQIGDGTRIWNGAQVREDVRIGDDCIIGKNVYIDFGVSVGSRTKIQNNSSVFHGVTIEDGVFIGPHVCFCNDLIPRAITPEGELKSADDWTVGPVLVKYGASVGAGSIITPNVTIGSFALVGAGSVVTRDVPDHALVYGNPARTRGYVCRCGSRLQITEETAEAIKGQCTTCGRSYTLPLR